MAAEPLSVVAGAVRPGAPGEAVGTLAGNPARLSVYYDGECPVCRIEVAFYRRRDKAGHLAWVDITRLGDADLPAGKSRDDLLRRFHVADRSGAWYVGVDAFAAIWNALPGFRYFAWLFRAPGLRQCAGLGYRGFLFWQQRHRARRLAAGR